MGDSIRVRQATIPDLETLASLFDEYRIFYGQESELDKARAFLFNRFEHNESILFLAEEAETGEGLGFAQLYPSFSSVSMQRIWILNDLFVREKARGRHVGKRLLAASEEFARLTRAKRIELTTATTNETARRLYERNGYKEDREFIKYMLHL